MPELEEAPAAHMINTGAIKGTQLWCVLAGLQLVLLLAALDQTVVSTAMPHIVAQLNGFDLYAWVTTAYLLTSTAAVPVFGAVSDVYGRKRVFLPGIFLFVLASVLCGSSGALPVMPGMYQLIFSRALQGIAAGNMMGLTFTLIADLFSAAERGRYQGVFAAVFAVASLLGPALGGYLADSLSWRYVFFINVPVGLFALVVLYAALPASPAPKPEVRVDYAGVGLLLLCLTPLLIALSLVPYFGWISPYVVALMALSTVFLMALLFCEKQARHPFIPLALFRQGVINISAISLFVTGTGMFGSLLLLPLFFQSVLGFSAAASGMLLAPLIIVVAGSSIAGGFLLSYLRRCRAIAVAGFIAMSAGTLLLSGISEQTSLTAIIAAMLVVGVGLGLLLPIYTIVIQNESPPEMMGIATGLSQFFRSIGGTLGTAAFGSLMLASYRGQIASRLPGHLPGQAYTALDNPLQPMALKSKLQAVLGSTTGHNELIAQTLAAVKLSLISAVDTVFFIYAVVLALTLFLNLFLQESVLKGPAAKS